MVHMETPFNNWFSWLFHKLKAIEYSVLVPQFPTQEFQAYQNWSVEMDSYKSFLGKNTVFIGHSLGCPFTVNYLLDNSLQIKSFVSVAGFYGLLNRDDLLEIDTLNSSFFTKIPLELSQFSTLSQDIVCFISDNDPYLSTDLLNTFAAQIHSKNVYFIRNADHFNTDSGYTEFPILLKYLID